MPSLVGSEMCIRDRHKTTKIAENNESEDGGFGLLNVQKRGEIGRY